MEFVSELKPNPIGRDHFRAIAVPFVVSFLYFALLFLQTFIKETNEEYALGYTYFFKGYTFGFTSPLAALSSNFFIISSLAIWIAIRTINLDGTIGNVGISGVIFGAIYNLLDLIFYITFVNETINLENQQNQDFQNQQENETLIDFISQERELLVSSFLFNLLEFVFLCILFSGIYVELTKRFATNDSELYPEA